MGYSLGGHGHGYDHGFGGDWSPEIGSNGFGEYAGFDSGYDSSNDFGSVAWDDK